jgi:predicted DNA-binding transcriptional regulator
VVDQGEQMTEELDEEQIAELLKGKTMKVYALLLTQSEMRMRDIQHKLNFSSPSLVIHHLNKLMAADLVEKDAYGDYSVKREVRVGSLTLFVQFGKYFLPRFIFQASLLLCIVVPYVLFFMSIPPDGKDILFLFVVGSTVILLIYEAYRMWFLSPV